VKNFGPTICDQIEGAKKREGGPKTKKKVQKILQRAILHSASVIKNLDETKSKCAGLAQQFSTACLLTLVKGTAKPN